MMKSLTSLRISLFLLAIPALILGVVAGCTSSRQPALAPNPVVPALTLSAYIGNDACTQCHVEAARGFSETNHARTFRPMTPVGLGTLAPPTGPIPDSPCVLEQVRDSYGVRVPTTGEQKTLSYALGSGKTGITYVSIENNTRLTEISKSYFPSRKQWFTTPGQEEKVKNQTAIGRDYGNLRACLLCHTVTLPTDSLHPEPKFMGVGCEACHGPARAHAEALTHGKRDETMETLTKASSDRINTVCGRCHRTVEEVLAKPVSRQTTQRFPVYGLASSRCYQASGGKLTCITCHNPHQNAKTDPKFYEAVCLNCHTSSPNNARKSVQAEQPHHQPVQGKVCPVNALSGCISCHLPSKRVFTDTSLPTSMADHLIKIYR